MTRYFFHLHECGEPTVDEEGADFADVAGARAKALQSAREVMCAEVKEGRLCLSCHVSIHDAAGIEVEKVPFRDAIAISGLHDVRSAPR